MSCRSGEADQQGGDSYGKAPQQLPIFPISHWLVSSGLRFSTCLRALQQGSSRGRAHRDGALTCLIA